MTKYFGTDGVRGVANKELTPELAFRIGRFGAYVLTKKANAGKPRIVVGRDTRISGTMLESALVAGMQSIGADVIRVGVISTPGVSFVTRYIQADAGVMISASHNPVEDNGIKFFGGDGFKLLDTTEEQIEQLLDETDDPLPRPIGKDLGNVDDQPELAEAYVAFLQNTVSADFTGMKIVLDCANGAAYQLAPELFTRMGAEVVTMYAEPNGLNINEQCGSTHPESLQKAVVEHAAQLGLSFDGDADRLIAVDEKGELVDGDYILTICGDAMKAAGTLKHNTVVSTVMANLGFYEATKKLALETVQTAVGDRYVMEAMRNGGYNLGGEQSGHIIFLDYNRTGDGLLTAIQLVQVVKQSGQTLSTLKQKMRKYPQLLVNVRVKDKNRWDENVAIGSAIRKGEQALAENGRLLVRASGTEALIRVMAEGPDEQQLDEVVSGIADVIKRELA